MDKTEKAITQAISTLDKLKVLLESDTRSFNIIQTSIDGIKIVKSRYKYNQLQRKGNPDKLTDFYRKEHLERLEKKRNEKPNQRNI